MNHNAYKMLAERLHALPNGYPPTADGVELRLLAQLFTEEEAELGSQLRLRSETAEQIADRLGLDQVSTSKTLKSMAKRGLIAIRVKDREFSYSLLPFVVGIYENQIGRIDKDTALIFEDYYKKAFGATLALEPQVHRVIPIGESIQMNMEIHPYESAHDIIDTAQAWGITDCICRVQKNLVGESCGHPVDVCMMISPKPGVYANHPHIRPVSKEDAFDTLDRAAKAGLVHSVTNNQEGLYYICNCCTCSCGILRGLSELGIANAVAKSAFVNHVDEELCYGCEICLDACMFDALHQETPGDPVWVDQIKCVGCGVCVGICPDHALILVRKSADEVVPPPLNLKEWGIHRAAARGIDLNVIM